MDDVIVGGPATSSDRHRVTLENALAQQIDNEAFDVFDGFCFDIFLPGLLA